jgi:endonuclease/exonuclease/phosphatase family metal-dependent hydrolase
MKKALHQLSFIFSCCIFTAAHSHAEETVRVATWNVEHLAYPITAGCRPRTKDELDELKAYAYNLNADIVALQEVASKQAVEQLFPSEQWQVIVSARPDSEGYECRDSGRPSTQQKVAFAVKNEIEVKRVEQLEELGLERPGLRFGLQLEVATTSFQLNLLNVHMKSGCFVDNYSRSDTESCATFAKQAPILDNWVESQEQSGKAFVVLGDFNHRLTAPYNHLTQALYRNEQGERNTLRNTGAELIGCHPYYPAPIDNIFVGNMNNEKWHYHTKIVSYENIDVDAMLSDHCAVVSTIRYQNEEK